MSSGNCSHQLVLSPPPSGLRGHQGPGSVRPGALHGALPQGEHEVNTRWMSNPDGRVTYC